MLAIKLRLLLLVLLTAHLSTVYAASGIVELIQMPAWIEHEGVKKALKPGDEISSGDRIITGKNARILVRLAEESFVKLGEEGEIDFKETSLDTTTNTFSGIIDVLNGAFRYTTTKLGRQFNRNIDFKIRNITAGIRGTDIWGKSTDEKNLLCLIEGKISAQKDGEPSFTMDKPLSYFSLTPANQTTNIVTVDTETLNDWSQQTEKQTGQGVITTAGEWAVNLMSTKQAENVEQILDLLNKEGYYAEVVTIDINGQEWSRIQIRGFETSSDAKYFAEAIHGQHQIVDPWVLKF